MTAITLTAETAVGDLRTELRRIEELLDGADTLDAFRARLDELTAALRSARGRVAWLARQSKPRPEPKPAEVKPSPTPVPPKATPVPPRPVEPKAVAERMPAKPAPIVPERKPAAAATPARAAQCVRRVSSVRFMLATLTVTLTALWGRASRVAACGVRAMASAARRARGRLARAGRESREDVCIVCGPGCCSPILGVHTSCPGPRAGATVVGLR